jgi:hypothetical protein
LARYTTAIRISGRGRAVSQNNPYNSNPVDYLYVEGEIEIVMEGELVIWNRNSDIEGK